MAASTTNNAPEKPAGTLPPSRLTPSVHATEHHSETEENWNAGSNGPPSRDQSDFFAATLEHIVRQLDILTQTVTVMEERLTHVENIVAHDANPIRGSATGVFAPRRMMDNNDYDDDDDEDGATGMRVS